MSLLAIFSALSAGAVVAILILRGKVRGPDGGDPTCGHCGYNVTGLTSDICPECGSDVRVVGIRRPGDRRPMSRRARLVLWSIISLPPALIIGQILTHQFAPVRLLTQRTRVIFSHVQGVFETVQATGTTHGVVFGAAKRWQLGNATEPPAAEVYLQLQQSKSGNVLGFNRTTGRLTFSDAAGRPVVRTGPIDDRAVADWLAAHGFVGEAAEGVARDVAAAAAEMDTTTANTFRRFSRPGANGVVAHPMFVSRSTTPTIVSAAAPFAFTAAVWSIGVIVIVRRRYVAAGPVRT